MNNFLYVFILLFFSHYISGQDPCSSNSPFGVSSTADLCANDGQPTLISFTIFNEGDPGTYEINFPDGMDTTINDVAGNVSVNHLFDFDCEDMPGNPIRPSMNSHTFSYLNELLITRTDCIDTTTGQFSIGYFNFNVIVNPVNELNHSRTDCIDAPFLVDIRPDICDRDLVEGYQWFIDGIPVDAPTGTEERLNDYSFPGPGSYIVRLEVTDYFDCGPYSTEKEIIITAQPSIIVSIQIDSSQLCDPVIQVSVSNTSLYSDTFSWSSTSPDVSFSDPTASNPQITINNTGTGTYTIRLEASNADCGPAFKEFEITTFDRQLVAIISPIMACTETQISICDFVDYTPMPSSVNWTSSDAGVVIADPNDFCPLIQFDIAGNFMLQVSGTDICDNPFSADIPISITPSQNVVFHFSDIDTLCESGSPIDLDDYITPSDFIEIYSGDGVSGHQFDPTGNIGLNVISFIDSCGINYDVEILVINEGGFLGGNLDVCLGDTINLGQIQAGSYSGNGIINNVFYSSIAGLGSHTISFEGMAFCVGESQFQINVVDHPVANFNILNNSCSSSSFVFPEGETLDINNSSAVNVLCYSIIETNEEICGSSNVQFTFPSSGEYTIQQIVQSATGGCTDTTTQTVFIESAYTPEITFVSDTTDCDSIHLSFTIDSIKPAYTYFWQFSNGRSSNAPNAEITVERPFSNTSFFANLQVFTFCDTFEYQTEFEFGARFQASFDILNDNNTLCSGETAYFQNTSSNYDSLSVLYNSNNVSAIFLDSIVYFNHSDTIVNIEIRVEAFKLGCPPLIVTDTLRILPTNTVAEFSLNYDQTCSPVVVTLMNSSTPGANDIVIWGDGTSPQQIASLAETEHEYNFSRDTTIIITLISSLCGVDTIQKELRIFSSPNISFEYFAVNQQCNNDSIRFFMSGELDTNFDVDWDFGDMTFSHAINPTHVFDAGGIYDVSLTVTDTNGCSSITNLSIDIDSYAGANLEVDIPSIVCENQIFDLNIISSDNEVWIDYGNGRISSGVLHSPYPQQGEYILTFTTFDNNGCHQDTSVLVSVISPIEVTIIAVDTVIELGDQIRLDFTKSDSSRNIETILWLGDAIDQPNNKITLAMPHSDGYYSLCVVDEFGCPAKDSIYVPIAKNYDEVIYIPNVFTPNDDGVNDRFYIYSKPGTISKIRTFQVYNRWGGMVFECFDCFPDNPEFGWDGDINGIATTPNVFTWHAIIEFADGEVRLFKGDVTLLK